MSGESIGELSLAKRSFTVLQRGIYGTNQTSAKFDTQGATGIIIYVQKYNATPGSISIILFGDCEDGSNTTATLATVTMNSALAAGAYAITIRPGSIAAGGGSTFPALVDQALPRFASIRYAFQAGIDVMITATLVP